MFLPPTTALGAGLYSITLYGGLVSIRSYMLFLVCVGSYLITFIF